MRHGADPHYRSSIAEEATSRKEHVFFCRPDGTALGAALSRRNVKVARILWEAEINSPLTITVDSGHTQTGEWNSMCYGRAQQLWDDTKSELSGMSERRPPSRGYAKYKRSRLTGTTGEPDYTAMKTQWQHYRSIYLHRGSWHTSRRISRSASTSVRAQISERQLEGQTIRACHPTASHELTPPNFWKEEQTSLYTRLS